MESWSFDMEHSAGPTKYILGRVILGLRDKLIENESKRRCSCIPSDDLSLAQFPDDGIRRRIRRIHEECVAAVGHNCRVYDRRRRG